jgi:hypothetical protein
MKPRCLPSGKAESYFDLNPKQILSLELVFLLAIAVQYLRIQLILSVRRPDCKTLSS